MYCTLPKLEVTICNINNCQCRTNVKSIFWSVETFLTLKAQTPRTVRSRSHSHWKRLYRMPPVISLQYSLVPCRPPG